VRFLRLYRGIEGDYGFKDRVIRVHEDKLIKLAKILKFNTYVSAIIVINTIHLLKYFSKG